VCVCVCSFLSKFLRIHTKHGNIITHFYIKYCKMSDHSVKYLGGINIGIYSIVKVVFIPRDAMLLYSSIWYGSMSLCLPQVSVVGLTKRHPETSNLVYKLTIASPTLPTKHHPWKGRGHGHMTRFRIFHPWNIWNIRRLMPETSNFVHELAM